MRFARINSLRLSNYKWRVRNIRRCPRICKKCNGFGKLRCNFCDGYGKLKELRQIKCNYCLNGLIMCVHCQGKGKM